MTLSEYFALERGRQITLARTLGIPQANVSRWADGINPAPAELGADIERATGGQVTRQELFPDTWARIWPELVAPAADRLLKTEETPTIDHAAELRGAIAQTRLVFEGCSHAEQALDYLELVLTSNIAKSIAATLTEMKDAMPTAASVPLRDNSALAQIKRELFTTANQLQQPADLVVQLLAELRAITEVERGEKIVDALCAMAVAGTNPVHLAEAGKSLVAAVRAIPTDLSYSSNG